LLALWPPKHLPEDSKLFWVLLDCFAAARLPTRCTSQQVALVQNVLLAQQSPILYLSFDRQVVFVCFIMPDERAPAGLVDAAVAS
jgi:hypothetical protein